MGLVEHLHDAVEESAATQIEHWNGVDVSVNARLQHGVLIQGGFSVGRTSTDNCAVVAQARDLIVNSVLGTATPAAYCHMDTNLMGQTQVKILGTYLIPKVDVNFAATFQSVPGPQISANYLGAERRRSSRRSGVRCRAAPPTSA